MTGWSGPKIVGRPPGGTCTEPRTTPSLVSSRATRRGGTAGDPEADPVGVGGTSNREPSSRSRASARTSRRGDRARAAGAGRGRRRVAGARRRVDGSPVRGRRTNRERGAGCQRRRPQAREQVGGPGAEDWRHLDAAADREVAAQALCRQAELDALPGRDRHRLAGPSGPAAHPHRDGAPVTAIHTGRPPQAKATEGDLDDRGIRRVADQPVGQSMAGRSAAPERPTPRSAYPSGRGPGSTPAGRGRRWSGWSRPCVEVFDGSACRGRADRKAVERWHAGRMSSDAERSEAASHGAPKRRQNLRTRGA